VKNIVLKAANVLVSVFLLRSNVRISIILHSLSLQNSVAITVHSVIYINFNYYTVFPEDGGSMDL
jgi:hypothetical protein